MKTSKFQSAGLDLLLTAEGTYTVVETTKTGWDLISANPDSPITRSLKDGTIRIEYDLVQALPGGQIRVTPFVLDPAALKLPNLK